MATAAATVPLLIANSLSHGKGTGRQLAGAQHDSEISRCSLLFESTNLEAIKDPRFQFLDTPHRAVENDREPPPIRSMRETYQVACAFVIKPAGNKPCAVSGSGRSGISQIARGDKRFTF